MKKENVKAENILKVLYQYYIENSDLLPQEFIDLIPRFDLYRIVSDFISGMTDNFAIDTFTNIFVPKPWK